MEPNNHLYPVTQSRYSSSTIIKTNPNRPPPIQSVTSVQQVAEKYHFNPVEIEQQKFLHNQHSVQVVNQYPHFPKSGSPPIPSSLVQPLPQPKQPTHHTVKVIPPNSHTNQPLERPVFPVSKRRHN